MENREWDEEPEVKHNVHEETTYEIAERHYQEEQRIAYEKTR